MVSIGNPRRNRTAALAALLRPPRLRALEEAGGERHATWTELFFDLVFVVAIAELAHLLHDDPTPVGFLRFGALFVPCWWAWVLFTFYSDRFDTDDIAHRLSMLAGMLAVVALAVNLHDAFTGGWTGFVLSYLLVRSIVLALYLRAARYVPAARANLALLLVSYVSGTGLWLLSIFVPAPLRYALWAVGMTIEVTAPIVGMKLFARGAAVSASHLPERFGLFTIIVLGEAVVAVATGTAGTNWRPASVVAAIAGFGIAACLWWAYFAFLERAVVIRGPWSVHLYNDGHLPILAGLTMVGVGIQFAIEGAGAAPLAAGPRWALCGGVALYLATTSALYLATTRTLRNVGLGVSLTIAGVALALAIFGGMLPALALEGVLLIALVGLVGYKILHLAAEEAEERARGEGAGAEEAPTVAFGR